MEEVGEDYAHFHLGKVHAHAGAGAVGEGAKAIGGGVVAHEGLCKGVCISHAKRVYEEWTMREVGCTDERQGTTKGGVVWCLVC